MKANELMLGDFFRVNKDGLCIKKGTIVRVVGIDGEAKLEEKGLVCAVHCHPLDGEQFDGGIWLSYLEPISITPEILEKNGWVIDEKNEVVSRFVWAQKPPQNKLEFTTVEISLYDEELIGVKCLVEIRCSSSSNGINSFHSCDCENIHQLQAALRLCGIEKEIVL
jgi:hypothetical protein